MNKGLNLELEKQQQDGTEYQFGSFSDPCITDLANIDRIPYLPKGELQNIGEEKQDCVSRGYNNILETKFNWLIKNNKLIPSNLEWLTNKGYINNGQFEVSDAFVAINGKTTRQGASMKAPVQAIHEHGLIPKKLMPQLSTFDEYHDPRRITPELKQLGLDFLKRFPINYEQVNMMLAPELLKEDLLNVAGYAWPKPINGVYPKPESFLSFNHDFILFSLPMSYAFDNYYDDQKEGDFIKQLAPDYTLYEYGYRVYIAQENNLADVYTPIVKDSWATFKALLNAIAVALGLIEQKIDLLPKKPVPIVPPTPPVVAKLSLSDVAKSYIGKDASPLNKAPQNLACVEGACTVIQQIIPDFPSLLSTIKLDEALKKHPRCKATLTPEKDCVLVAITKGKETGHAGFLIENYRVISNDSTTGKMADNYSFINWVSYFRGRGLITNIYKIK